MTTSVSPLPAAGTSDTSPLLGNDPSVSYDSAGLYAPEEDPHALKEKRIERIAIAISVFVMFMGSIMFSITLSSMVYFFDILEGVPTIEARDPTQSHYPLDGMGFYGLIVAAFSLGQAISSPPFGYWYNHRSARGPYIFGMCFIFFGSVLYFLCVGKWMMFFARLIIGIGAGTATVCRTHVAVATPVDNRTGAMALVAAAQAVGFIIGPAFSLAFGDVNLRMAPYLFFDKYTVPGFVSCLLAVISFLAVVFLFRETELERMNKLNARLEAGEQESMLDKVNAKFRTLVNRATTTMGLGSVNSSDDSAPIGGSSLNADTAANVEVDANEEDEIVFDRTAIYVNMVIFFFITSSFSVFETIATPFTSVNFGWSVADNSLFLTLAGLSSVVSFIAVKPLSARVGDRPLLFVGLILAATGLLIRVGFGYPDWVISETQYWISTFCLYTIGYPISNAICFSVFSKIMGPAQQGTLTGWHMLVGAVARLVGPLWASALFEVDQRAMYVFGLTAAMNYFAAVLVLVFWKRLVPYGENEHSSGYRAVPYEANSDSDSASNEDDSAPLLSGSAGVGVSDFQKPVLSTPSMSVPSAYDDHNPYLASSHNDTADGL
ncbi:hypothetical protein H696_02452 [Fonticula alba]|uniref:Major facilitator superfamily (MFS) profile domain-containing protein n=1 Tax=Fonticula alba TaxID=691883 RepID=A0A058ZC49_FONAL|nr:hypothetical protein H696_02452 [Fonticula alba]KCV71508.1 hypothetical protein H696_02452 [Fonticula alba]|eukprot:XP_009494631.1 hypothetical protein H696_02452 [Fonticula alba]